jgi:hypothetical protein
LRGSLRRYFSNAVRSATRTFALAAAAAALPRFDWSRYSTNALDSSGVGSTNNLTFGSRVVVSSARELPKLTRMRYSSRVDVPKLQNNNHYGQAECCLSQFSGHGLSIMLLVSRCGSKPWHPHPLFRTPVRSISSTMSLSSSIVSQAPSLRGLQNLA